MVEDMTEDVVQRGRKERMSGEGAGANCCFGGYSVFGRSPGVDGCSTGST
jgi:hypothetical protein